jgi:cyclic pyranopterin phosphate synthase
VIVRFIEYMDVGNRNDWRPELVVPSRELLARIGERWPLQPLGREYPGEVAERYGFTDGNGEVGFISSVTQPFCGDCSRARLSSDGVLYTCLFATRGTSLRDALRSGADDDQLLDVLRRVWMDRADNYSEQRQARRESASATRKVEMFYIGG